jgi:hypothetical protein
MTYSWQYLCTQNAHDAESLTDHMNNRASEGWELLAVTFAVKGEGGVHSMFWRHPLIATGPEEEPA